MVRPATTHQARVRVSQARVRVSTLVTFAAACAVASAAPAAKGRPDIRAFSPEADTYVSSSHPRENFGRARVLRVDGAPETTAFLRFKLEGDEEEIAGVTLLLHPKTAGRARYAVRRVHRNDWRERRLTFGNAPRRSQRYVSSSPVRRGMWSAVDVTAFVDHSEPEVSLAITTLSAREISFGSRESRFGPRLVVQYSREDDGERQLRKVRGP
jgi:hypothetical protein